ncbi:hypothetical protein MRX96_001355 [Rhipicephalus microplus]
MIPELFSRFGRCTHQAKTGLDSACIEAAKAWCDRKDEGYLTAQTRHHESFRNTREAVVASTTVAAARNFAAAWTCKRLEHLKCFVAGPSMGLLTAIEHATYENFMGRKISIARSRCHVATANTWRISNGAAVNSKGLGAFARYHSGMTTTKNTSVLQKVISHDTMRTAAKKRYCEVAPADHVSLKWERPKPKTPRLEFKEFQAAALVNAWEVSATMQTHTSLNSKNEDSGPKDSG